MSVHNAFGFPANTLHNSWPSECVSWQQYDTYQVANIPASYFEGPGFRCRPISQISTSLMVFLSFITNFLILLQWRIVKQTSKAMTIKHLLVFKALLIWNVLYYLCYGNEHTSTTVSDVDRYVIFRKLPYFQHTSRIETPAGNSNTLTQDISFRKRS
jgi:hypothetical protein